MLAPEQVVPFLSDPDPSVRRLAAEYFSNDRHPKPDVAEDFWRAIDALGREHAVLLLSRLSDLPQTRASLERCVAEIERMPANPKEEAERDWQYHLYAIISRADATLLKEIGWRPAPGSSPYAASTSKKIEMKLDVLGKSFDERWDALVDVNRQLMEEADDGEGNDSADDDSADDDSTEDADEQMDEDYEEDEDDDPDAALHALAGELTLQLSREPRAVERATQILRDKVITDWLELFAIDIVGAARHEPAIPLLFDRLAKPEDEALAARAADALADIGTEAVVRRLVEQTPLDDYNAASLALDVLHLVKKPYAAEALADMLRRGLPDKAVEDDILTFLAGYLIDCLPTDPGQLELLRQTVLSRRWKIVIDSLDEQLLTAGKMVGYTPPEAEQWRRDLTHRAQDVRKAMREEMQGIGILSGLFGQMTRRRSEEDEDDAFIPELPPSLSDRYPEPTMPIHRDTPKVGRNDPCPCGSGKKYKKCCLNK